MRKTIIATGVLALGLGGGAQAQDAGDATVLDTITVTTPLRRESSLERSTSSVTVIEKEEIERSPAVDLPSLLRTFPGVNVTTNGGMGASASLGLRGANASQTLVLVDGINVRSATLGTTALQNIPLGAIERIEIAKGPHSAQYGADAIGGVVNIITKRGGADCPDGKAICTTVTAGVLYPWGGYTNIDVHGTSQDGTRFNVGGKVIGTRGYDFTTAPTEPDDDGFLLGSLNLSVEKDFAWGQAYASALYSRSRVEFDSSTQDEADTATLAAKIGARVDHAHDWHSRVEFSVGYDDQENFRRGMAARTHFETLRYGVFASTTKEFETGGVNHTLTFGGEAYRESIKSSSVYDVTDRNRTALFAQHSLEFGALTIDSGIRYDDDEIFGGATTYNVGASYVILPGLTARASYGTGFRAPTFNDLFWPSDPYSVGNPDLKPERSRGYEVGLSWRPTEATVLDLAFYQSWVRDQINWGPLAGDPDFRWAPSNIERVNVTGFEASLSHRFNSQWRGRAWFDIRNPRDQDDLYVMNQERLKVGMEVGYRPLEELELTLGVLHVGPRMIPFSFPASDYSSYTLVDIGAVYSFDAHSRLKLSVSNLFDKQYSTNQGYRSPGRTIDVSFTKTF